ncbi:MAG TPA: flagellar export chaperone FlgN [Nitrospira sp.]|nr:flagellar export chaperone FlgN [Nitrospira sp.]
MDGQVPIVNASISLEQLLHILARESAHCDLLAQNIVQERDAIKRMALSEFLSINQSRISILESLHRLKDELDLLLDGLANTYQVPLPNRTITEILHRVQSPQTGVILEKYERLAEKVRAVKQDIAANQVLIHSVQSFLFRALEAHRQALPEGDLYSELGSRQQHQVPAAVIRRQG